MIKLFLYTLLAILTGLVVTLFLAREPGYLLVSFAGYTFESSLFALFVALIVFLLAARLLVLVIAWINPLNLVSWSRSWSARRRARRDAITPVTPALREQQFIVELNALRPGTDDGSSVDAAEVKKFWKKHGKPYMENSAVVAEYIDVLVSHQAYSDAIEAMEIALDRKWSDGIIRRYSFVSLFSSDSMAVKQLQRAEGWLEIRPLDHVLLLALGRLSLRSQLWGKAKEYFERSMKIEPDTEVFAELARLMQRLNEPDKNAEYLRLQTSNVGKILPQFPQP